MLRTRDHRNRIAMLAARAASTAAAEALEGRTLFSAGDLDPGFSGDGVANTTPGGYFEVVALDHRGGRTVVLASQDGGGSGPTGANLVAYNSAGNLDTTFSSDGKRPMPRLIAPQDVFIQPDGKILVAGIVDGTAGVARLLPNGAADTSFSGDGFATFPQFDVATGVRVAPNGKVVVSGWDRQPPNQTSTNPLFFAAARLNANGTPDTGFSGDGVAVTDYTGVAHAVAVQADGKVVLVGTHTGSGSEGAFDVGVVRLTTAGGYDNTFSGDGRFAYDYSTDDAGLAVDLAPDGKILVGAQLGQNIGGAIRLTASGALDLEAKDEGVAVFNSVNGSVGDIRSSFDGSQFYLFVRETNGYGDPLSVVARFDSDGTRDLTFGDHGAIVGSGEGFGDLTADGKVVTAGNPAQDPNAYPQSPDPTKLVVRRRLTATPAADRISIDKNTIYVEGTTGNDTVRATYDGQTNTITVRLNATTKTYFAGGVTRIVVDGGLGDDDVRTNASNLKSVVDAGYGNDYVLTGAAADVVHGGGGNDTINTGDGDDYADGGDGDDVVTGGNLGNDQLYGGRGKDRLFGYAGNDRLCGAYPGEVDAAADYLDGGTGTDTVVTKEGLDAVSGIEKFE